MRLFTWSSFGFVAVSLAAVVAACSGGQSEPQTDGPPSDSASAAPVDTGAPAMPTAAATTQPTNPTPTAVASTEPTPPAKPTWKDMSFDQRKDFMKNTFMPALAKDFTEFDGKKYKDVSCVLCHGAGAKDGKFKMPNPGLPKLNPKDGFKKHMTKAPKVTKFMMEKVVGDSATTLGVAPFDPSTKSGFGCGGCHLIEGM